MASMANLFLTGQVGQEGPGKGQLDMPASGGKDADFCTGGEKVTWTGRWCPEGMLSFIPFLWPELISITAFQGLLFICVPIEEADNRKSLQVPALESDQLTADCWLCYFLAVQLGLVAQPL